MPTASWILDAALAAGGVIVLLSYLRLQRQHVWILPNLREHRKFRPEHVLLPMVAHMMVNLSAGTVLTMVHGPESSGQDLMLANVLASVAGGLAAGAVGAVLFTQGLRGFVIGPGSWQRALVWGCAGWLVSMPLCWGAAELSIEVIERLRPGFQPPAHAVMELMQQGAVSPWITAMLWASAVGIAPLAEEFFFRGVLQSAVLQVLRRPVAAMAVAAVPFGLAHAGQMHAILPLMILGFLLGYVYERSGSLLAPVVLHGLFNLKNMLSFALLDGVAAA